jgi:cellulose synthase/poly-beta-1,6-N-acetylglucosamine synthase-like glycosyltransferase
LALVELYRNRPGKREEVPPIPDAELPTYSVLVPLFREISVLPDLIDAMSDLDYPTGLLDILLVIEDADLEMQAALIGMDLPGHFRVVVVPDSGPRTKPKALNYALASARGEFIVVFDAEDRPDIDQLRKAAACFRASPPEVACVQARLNIYNAQESWISRQFAIEYSALFDAILPSLERYGFPIPLGGTSNHFSRQALQDMGGWDPFNVTEDADLGIRLARRGRTTLILESTTWEEAPVFLKQWFRQRTRWLKGWMQTWLVHMRRPVRLISDLGAWQFAGLQIVMGGILLSALVHPFFYVFSATEALGLRMPLPDGAIGNGLLWAGWITLVLGFGAAALVGMIAAHRRRQSLTWSFMLLPAYWLLISAAAYRALWQLWRDPYYWEKTPHGVSKRRSPRPPQRRSQRAR